MTISQDQLVEDMVYYLKSFSSNPSGINEETIHESVLNDDGFGTATPKRIYKALVRFSISKNGGDDKTWPVNWLKLSVRALAAELLS